MIRRYIDFIMKHIRIPETQGNSDLENLRNQLFAAVMSVLVPLGFFIAIINILLAFNKQVYSVIVLDVLVYITIFISLFIRIPIKAKRYIFPLIIEVLAVILLVIVPIKLPAMIWMIGVTLISSAMVSYRSGYFMLFLNLIIQVIYGCYEIFILEQNVIGMSARGIVDWSIIILNFFIVNAMCVFVLAELLKGMEHNNVQIRNFNEELIQKEEELFTMYSTISEAIIIYDHDHKVMIMNYRAEELTGCTLKEAKGRRVEDIYHIERKDKIYDIDEKTFIQGILTSRNQNSYEIEENVTKIEHQGLDRAFNVIVFKDMTKYHQVENELRHMQKMQAVGQLASGVAHDFNNMLAGILGYAELIELKSEKESEVHRYSMQIINTTHRASDLTSQLLGFSRVDNKSMLEVPLHLIINNGIDLLRRTFNPIIRIDTDFADENIVIKGDQTQIQNMILNLGINAKDAMPEGGLILITTSIVYMGENNKILSKFKKKPGKYVKIDIRDEGIGMIDEVRERIFEPFYTTKPLGEGTGLGLSTVYNTVDVHNGIITVSSEIDQGTVFTVYLPVL